LIDALAAAIEASAPATALRQSLLAYPLVNAGHVLGIALLVGAVVALDLRLLGLWSDLPDAGLRRVLAPIGSAGFLLALVTGLALFATRASEYLASPLFLAKLGLIALAAANYVWASALIRSRRTGSPALRLAAALSILLWVGVLLLGRLVGYF
jgi:hypothetical protein